jgi:hypothetical protein
MQLQCGLAELVINMTIEIINDPMFKEMARKSPGFFTRDRSMPFRDLMAFILFRKKNSLPSSLRRFFEAVGKDTCMSQQSLSEARAKLSPEAFEHLFKVTAMAITESRGEKWGGYLVYAVDGTQVALPSDKKLLEHFGGTGRNASSPTARASALYDVLNDTLVDVAISAATASERALAMKHIAAAEELRKQDKKLLIYDRGYASFDFIEEHERRGLFYLMRIKKRYNHGIDSQTAADGYVQLEKNGKRIRARIIKFMLDSGEVEMLATNITSKRFGAEDFKKLYFMRWPIETKYSVIKKKLQLENFSARTVDGIKQEFFASMYLANFLACAAFDSQPDITKNRNGKGNKYEYKANLNELIGILKDRLVKAMPQKDPNMRSEIVRQILEDAKHYVVPIRPNRRTKRNPYPRASSFHHNQKVNC